MVTLQDVIDHSNLTEAEIDAIAEHEHIPKIVAAEMGDHLVKSPAGVPILKRIILEDIQSAIHRGDELHARELHLVLQHFVLKYSR